MQFTVFGAIVSCGSGSNTIRFTPPYRGVSIGDGWVGLESDVSPDYFGGTFGTCAKRKDEDCKECDMCLFDKWFCPNTSVLYLPRVAHVQNSYLDHQNLPALRTVEVDGQAQALLTMNSHLVCSRGDKISFLTSGQNDPWTLGLRTSRPMSMSGKVYGSGLPDIPVRASNEAHDNKVLWVASQILIAHSWYSTHPRREIVITDKDGLILDRLTEGIDFYVGDSGLSYYINKEENRVKNVFPAAKPGDEPQTYTVTVGDGEDATPVVLHEGRDYYIGGDGEAYLYNSPRVVLEAKGFTLGFDTHSDGSAQITVSGLSERCWFDHGLSALFGGTLTSNIFTQGSQFYISADNQARMMRTKAPPPPASLPSPVVSGKFYTIKNVQSNLFVTVDGSYNYNKRNIYQSAYANEHRAQEFRFVEESTGIYRIYAGCSMNGRNKVLDVVRGGNPLASGLNVQLFQSSDNVAQLFQIRHVNDNQYKIVMSDDTDLALSTTDNRVIISTYTGSASQHWTFEPQAKWDETGYANLIAYPLPLTAVSTTSGYGRRDYRVGTEYHAGLDISGDTSTEIRSPFDGTVIRKEDYVTGYGKHLILEADNIYVPGTTTKIRVLFGHMSRFVSDINDRPLEEDDKVSVGQLIGYVGGTGGNYALHLHFSLIINGGEKIVYDPKITADPMMLYPDIRFNFENKTF